MRESRLSTIFAAWLALGMACAAHAAEISVASFGARGDGVTLETGAIQRAIDAAARQGDTVTFPAGTYLSGALFVRTGVTLRIDQGVVLRGSRNLADYPLLPARAALVNVYRERRVAIVGRGMIDGDGLSTRLVQVCDAANVRIGDGLLLRGAGIFFSGGAENIRIHDVEMAGVQAVLATDMGRLRDVRIWNLKATGAQTVFAASGHADKALERFSFENWDVQAASIGRVRDAKDWKLQNVRVRLGDGQRVQTLFGDERVIGVAEEQARGVAGVDGRP